MKWRKVTDIPIDNQLVWIMTYPHKQTVASLELHCGWVQICKNGSKKLWIIDNMDETGGGSQTWNAYANDEDFYADEYVNHCISETIMAWIPAYEFIYPATIEGLLQI